MDKTPLNVLAARDGELMERIAGTDGWALQGGALGRKEKLLIAMALDASHGAAAGVASLAGQALAAGATEQEILEALRVVYHISGVGSMYVAAQGLNMLLGGKGGEPDGGK